MDESAITACALRLLAGRRESRPHTDFSDRAQPQNLAEAYAVQEALVAAVGEAPIGWKIGCTSKRAQQVANTDAPFYGRMFPSTIHHSPATVGIRDLVGPIAEPEIALRLACDLSPADAPYSARDLVAVVAAMYPAFEIVDCRYPGGWPNVDIIKLVADNGVHSQLILGAETTSWQKVNRPELQVTAERNGTLITEGRGGNALGDPLNALAWLANNCSSRGYALKTGDLVTTGNLGDEMITPEKGDRLIARFGGLGNVEVAFVEV